MRTPGAKGRGQAGLASPAPRPEDLEPLARTLGVYLTAARLTGCSCPQGHHPAWAGDYRSEVSGR